MLKRKINPNTQKLSDVEKAIKKDYIVSEWQTLRGNGKRGYILNQLQKDVILGFFVGVLMHYRVGMGIDKYFTTEFIARAIIYTGIYSIGSILCSLYRWNRAKKKYKKYRRESLA